MAQSARVFIVPDRPRGCQSLTGLPARCKAENERPPITWMRPLCGSFAQLSDFHLKCAPSLPLKTSAGRCQCLADSDQRRQVAVRRGDAGQPGTDHAYLTFRSGADCRRPTGKWRPDRIGGRFSLSSPVTQRDCCRSAERCLAGRSGVDVSRSSRALPKRGSHAGSALAGVLSCGWRVSCGLAVAIVSQS